MTDQKETGYIYLITCTINNKQYVGQTRQLFKDRMRAHKNTANNIKNVSYNLDLYKDIRLYGWDKFSTEKIVTCTVEELNDLEVKYIEEYQTLVPHGYNNDKGGGVAVHTSNITRERRKLAAIKRMAAMTELEKTTYLQNIERGRKENPLSDDSKKQISESLKKYNVINPVQKETIDKRSLSLKRRGFEYPTYMNIRHRSGRTEYIINRHPLCRYKSYRDEKSCLFDLNILNILNKLNIIKKNMLNRQKLIDKLENEVHIFQKTLESKIAEQELGSETK